MQAVKLFAWSARISYAEFRAIYTWKKWVFGWLLRMLLQVSLFGLLGHVIGSPGMVQYLLVGTAVQAGMSSVAFAVQAVAWERRSGTLEILMASPSNPVVIYMGRGIQWLVDGIVTAGLCLVFAGIALGLNVQIKDVMWCALMICLSLCTMYAFTLLVSAFTLGAPRIRNLVSNVMMSVISLLSGLQVPLDVWPETVQSIAWWLPVTNGVLAIREILNTGTLNISRVGEQFILLILWGSLACIVFTLLFRRVRRVGIA